jgi:hypothetical protein
MSVDEPRAPEAPGPRNAVFVNPDLQSAGIVNSS